MSASLQRPVLPTVPLLLAGLVAATTVYVGLTGRQGTGLPPQAQAVATRTLRVADGPAGTIIATDGRTGQVLETLAPGKDEFFRITMRTLAETRLRRGLSARVPFTLSRYADGRLVLTDPLTGWHLDLEAFGTTNEADFLPLLPSPAKEGSTP